MVGCILTGHGEFAKGLASAVDMIAGPQEHFEIVTFTQDEVSDFPERLGKALADMEEACGNVVVFCDLLGGTPFNQSMLLSAESPEVEVVAGTNLPMLLECLCCRTNEMTASDLAELACESGTSGVDHAVLTVDDDEGDCCCCDGI